MRRFVSTLLAAIPAAVLCSCGGEAEEPASAVDEELESLPSEEDAARAAEESITEENLEESITKLEEELGEG